MSTETESDNKILLQGCFDGNEHAIRDFYDRFKNLLYAAIHGWISKSAPEADRAEDVQEVFHNVLILIMEDGFAKLRGLMHSSKISGYLYVMAYNETGRYFHKKWQDAKKKADEEPVSREADHLIEKLSQEERLGIVAEFMKTLSGREGDIMRCFYAEEMAYAEIGRTLGLSTSNVGVMISRIKDKCVKFIRMKYGERL
jgi:RNA polymerase sigma factor (sigma-70 family)